MLETGVAKTHAGIFRMSADIHSEYEVCPCLVFLGRKESQWLRASVGARRLAGPSNLSHRSTNRKRRKSGTTQPTQVTGLTRPLSFRLRAAPKNPRTG